MRRTFASLLLLLLPLTSLGCLGVQSSDDASLIVRFYFEYNADEDTWDGPDQLEVVLYDVSSGKREELDDYQTSDFYSGDTLHYSQLGGGLYELSIRGLDTRTGAAWASDCTGLLLDRFDEIYSCDVWLDDGSATGDAGVSMNATNQTDAGAP